MYQQTILKILATTNNLGFNPRHIEAYMRLGHSTLDGLSLFQFTQEVLLCVECIRTDGTLNAERCAESFGL